MARAESTFVRPVVVGGIAVVVRPTLDIDSSREYSINHFSKMPSGRVGTSIMNAGLHGWGGTSLSLRRACLVTYLLNVFARRVCLAGVLVKLGRRWSSQARPRPLQSLWASYLFGTWLQPALNRCRYSTIPHEMDSKLVHPYRSGRH